MLELEGAKPWQEAIFRLVPLRLTAATTLLMIGLWLGTSAYAHKFLFGLLAYLGMVWLAAGWSERWREGGVDSLANRPRSGWPLQAEDEYSRTLEDVIAKEPGEPGYDFAIWTSDRLRAHLKKETGIDLSDSRFRELRKRKGYRYRRPKQALGHGQDKKAKAQAAELLEELKKRSSETISGSSLWMKRP